MWVQECERQQNKKNTYTKKERHQAKESERGKKLKNEERKKSVRVHKHEHILSSNETKQNVRWKEFNYDLELNFG